MKLTKGHTINVLDHGFVRYIDHMGTDMDIVEAARVSYASPSKGEEADKKLLKYLFDNKHTSPFEMVKVKLDVKLPIFVARQWVRHRMQNMNEVSARYTQLPAEFYVPKPDEWRVQDVKNKQGSVASEKFDQGEHATNMTKTLCNAAYVLYEDLLKSGIAREMARMVLPLNIYTQFYCCWDLKNLLHFLALRDDSHAQAEIQEYAKAIKEILVQIVPWTMELYEGRGK